MSLDGQHRCAQQGLRADGERRSHAVMDRTGRWGEHVAERLTPALAVYFTTALFCSVVSTELGTLIGTVTVATLPSGRLAMVHLSTRFAMALNPVRSKAQKSFVLGETNLNGPPVRR